jgi:CelD/BcsL family acetyltransferase involved in cellulose biosynthesis
MHFSIRRERQVLKILECASLQELDSLRTEWDNLLEGADFATIYATWEWTEACWRFTAPGKQPLVLLARDGSGKLVGVLPLARTSKWRVVGKLEVLGCTPAGYPMGDYGGLIAARGSEARVLAAMMRHLKARGKWSIMDLRNCMADPPVREEQLSRLYGEIAGDLSLGLRIAETDKCRVLALPSTFDEYLAQLSSNTRQNIRRKLRRLRQAGHSLEAVDVKDEAARNAAMEAFYRLHQLRWTKNSMQGGFSEERVCAMHIHLAANLAARDWLDLRLVRSADGEIQGVIYNFKRNGAIYFYHIGFNDDEEWSPFSLGFCLLADSIEAAIEAGCHTFDLMRGDHEYKRHFGGRETRNLRITLYKPGWLLGAEAAAYRLRGRLRRGAHHATHFQPATE